MFLMKSPIRLVGHPSAPSLGLMRGLISKQKSDKMPYTRGNYQAQYKVADGRSTSNTRRKHEKAKIQQHRPKFNKKAGGGGRKATSQQAKAHGNPLDFKYFYDAGANDDYEEDGYHDNGDYGYDDYGTEFDDTGIYQLGKREGGRKRKKERERKKD